VKTDLIAIEMIFLLAFSLFAREPGDFSCSCWRALKPQTPMLRGDETVLLSLGQNFAQPPTIIYQHEFNVEDDDISFTTRHHLSV